MRRFAEKTEKLEANDESLHVTLDLPADLIWFQGHFPVCALLPGVVQLQWVLNYATRWLGPVKLREVPSTKFVRPIRPGETLQLSITKERVNDTDLSLRFEYRVIEQDHSVQASLGRLNVTR